MSLSAGPRCANIYSHQEADFLGGGLNRERGAFFSISLKKKKMVVGATIGAYERGKLGLEVGQSLVNSCRR